MELNKEILLKNIFYELNHVPAIYLNNIYEIIHTFRTQIPASNEEEPVFDWDNFIKDIYEQRESNNRNYANKITSLFD
ncbi:MAG: hypothetical protein ABFS35_18140 [Bacteroidota bacterium]